eukprot:TRINITY_DN5522_c0_g1_i6.p1 TRINITY_DN5522_c0_g1~~TRINITY_DN5522_c0_g1_i6.p1  ORF type:complete len:759 (+),score=144.25 TRINITY_DN5522_c0_g1_i6:51-2327(+)
MRPSNRNHRPTSAAGTQGLPPRAQTANSFASVPLSHQSLRAYTPDVLPQTRDIAWLFHALWAPNDKLTLPIPDTVLLDSGNIRAWFFTNKEGKVLKRNTLPPNDYSRVKQEFEKFKVSNSYQQPYIGVLRKPRLNGTHIAQALKIDGLGPWLEEPPVTRRNVICLQAYINGKHFPDTCFRVEYILQEYGKPYIYTLKSYTALQEAPLVRPAEEIPDTPHRQQELAPPSRYVRKFTPSRSMDLNGVLERYVSGMVKFIENHENVRVLKISAYFTQDCNDKLWFYHATHITTIDLAEDLDRVKFTRPTTAQEIEDEANREYDEDLDEKELEKIEKSFVASQSRIHKPRRCYGDYCNAMYGDQDFSFRKPLLEKDNRYVILNKSIVLARLEDRASRATPSDTASRSLPVVLATDMKELLPTDYYAEVTVCPTCYFIYLKKDMDRRELQEQQSMGNGQKDSSDVMDGSQQRDRLLAQLSRSIQRSTSPILRDTIVKKLRDLGETKDSISDYIQKEESLQTSQTQDKTPLQLKRSASDGEIPRDARTPSPMLPLNDSSEEKPKSRQSAKQAKAYPQVVRNSRRTLCRISSTVYIPFKIIQSSEKSIPFMMNFVVFNDFLDDLENYVPLFSPIVSRLPGSRILLFNYPGQARSKFDGNIPFNNAYAAKTFELLLQALEKEELFSLSSLPACLVSFGLGASVALKFGLDHKELPIKSILSINPVLQVDTHLSLIFENFYAADSINAKSPSNDAIQKVCSWFMRAF